MAEAPKCRECQSAAFMFRCLPHDGWRCDRCDICFVGEPPVEDTPAGGQQ